MTIKKRRACIKFSTLLFLILVSFQICFKNIYATEKIINNPLDISNDFRELSKMNFNGIKPNESGQIMILMYHGIDKTRATANYQRTVDGFKADLKKLYENGYRIISIKDLVQNDINVEAGYTPVVLTFDDALSTAFSFEEENEILVPKKDCAVDIINNFCIEHPEFGKGGVFFLSGKGRPPFFGKGQLNERFNYLINNGYELGNHTFSHVHMGKLSSEKIQNEMAMVEKIVSDEIPDYHMVSMAYPYGERPKKENRQYVLNGNMEAIKYNYSIALREGQSGASANPLHVNFDPLNIPRVRGTNNAKTDLGWFIKYYKNQPEKRFISDGNPNTVTIPVDYISNINIRNLGDKELILYYTD